MRTRNLFRYLLAAIVAIGTTSNALAQETTKSMRAYFSTYQQSAGVPTFTLNGDIPSGVTATAQGFEWAQKYSELWSRDCEDRVFAVKSSDKKSTHASVSFSNMKYEVKQVQWNRMNDVLNNSIIDIFRSFRVYGTVESFNGSKTEGNEGSWMFLGKQFTFGKEGFPPGMTRDLNAKGLSSLVIEEKNSTIIFNNTREINDRCRFFIKAGEVGSNDWAFQVTYYEPYVSSFNIPDMMLIDQEHQITTGDFSIAHPGAFYFTVKSYNSNNTNVISIDSNGKMKANNVGSAIITVTLSDGNKEISASKTVTVGTLTPQTGVYYYHKNIDTYWAFVEIINEGKSNRDEIQFNELTHSDGDYTFDDTNNTTDSEGFKTLGKLVSKESRDYKVGAKVIDFSMSAPAYTTVTSPFTFIVNSTRTTGVVPSLTSDYGGEVIVASGEYSNLILKTQSSTSDGSVYKWWHNSAISNSSADSNNGVLIDNRNVASLANQVCHVILVSAGDATYLNETVTTTYKYKVVSPVTTYYADITFDGNGGTITGSNTQTIAKAFNNGSVETENLQNVNISAPVGYTFNGWNTNADGTGEHYDANAAFRPSTTLTGGEGKGPVTLYAEWVPLTYTVTLDHQDGNNDKTYVTATYGQLMPSVDNNGEPFSVPTMSGRKFDGYYTSPYGVGEMYYTPEMASAKNWDISADATLYACWKYSVTLHHNGGTNSINTVYVRYNGDWPEAPAPIRTGYIFDGYYNRETPSLQCYDSEMHSVNKWGFRASGNIDARWTPKTTIITFDPKGGIIDYGTSVTAKYDEAMPLSLNAPRWNGGGYIFGGYYDQENGQGTQYYKYENNTISSARTWNKEDAEITLYAYWIPLSYTVTLKHNDGTNEVDKVSATMGQTMPSKDINNANLQAPVREGYTFLGYYAYNVWNAELNKNEDICWYDENMNSSDRVWNKAQNAEIEAKWQANKYIVTFDGTEGAIVPDQFGYYNSGTESELLQASNGIVRISFAYGGDCPRKMINARFKKAGFKFVGFYDAEDNLIATVDVDDASKRDIEFTVANNYWKEKDGKLVWNYPHNLTLTAKYVPKYTLEDGNIINFGNEYLELGVDWEKGEVNDAIGAVNAEKALGHISKTNPVMVFDLKNANYLDGSSKKTDRFMSSLEGNEYISPNALFYLGEGAYDINDCKNVIEKNNNTCKNLVVTDRYSMKIPYAFIVQNAIYERNKAQVGTDDAMWQQSQNSVWGTLCLPYPIQNNQSYTENGINYQIRFYELRNAYTNNQGQSYMQFYEMQNANQVIQANTPVLYCRTAGVGSAVPVKASGVSVPANNSYATTVINYRDKDQVPLAEESISDWRFVGTLEEKTFIGYDYKTRYGKAAAAGAIEVEKGRDIYYFASNKFTHMNPELGKLVVLPYRAYFEDRGAYSESKVSSYSILVVDEDGTTTDITNLIDNSEAKGDGKIYDLSGRRVKQPVKGSIYIVDGKKKMY